jgi:hypothetical protein
MGTEQSGVSRRAGGLVRSMRWILWALLLIAVVATMGGIPAIRETARGGRIPLGLTLVPVALVGAFIVGYAVYRFMLVRAGRYPAGKAMMQVALMTLFLTLLVRWAGDREAGLGADHPVDVGMAMASKEPEVRALAAEVLRARPREQGLPHVDRLVILLSDSSAEVRRQAHASLVFLAGRDLGEGAGAAARWRAAFGPP